MFSPILKSNIYPTYWSFLGKWKRHIRVRYFSKQNKKSLNINRSAIHEPRRNAISVGETTMTGTFWNRTLLLSKKRIDEFISTFPEIVEDLTEGSKESPIFDVNRRYADVLYYVVPFGKRLRAFTTIAAYELLEKPENLTRKNIKQVILMGWVEEVLQGALVIIDDIVDKGNLRRGVQCWHRKENIGLQAVNDALLVEQGVYTLLKKHFENHHCYLSVIDLLHEITMKTSMGEALDCMNMKNGKPILEWFTMERFKCIAEFKTGYYTFHMPIALAMYLANIYDPHLHSQVKALSKKVTFLYQMQDDYLDCYGKSSESGKKGNDIQEGKCTWLAVMALQKANPSQRKVMEKYYGSQEPGAVNAILNLFEELDLPKLYENCEKAAYNALEKNIKTSINNIQLQQVYFKIINAFNDRKC